MWLPTQGQVNAFTRNVASGIGGAVLMFGLSTKIDVATVNSIITATGTLVNDLVVLVGIASPFVAGYFASKSASPINQAKSLEAAGAIVVTTPEIARATPDSPNIVSQDQMKVVPK